MGTGAYLFFLFLNCRSFCTPNSQLLLLSSNLLSEKKNLVLLPAPATDHFKPGTLCSYHCYLLAELPCSPPISGGTEVRGRRQGGKDNRQGTENISSAAPSTSHPSVLHPQPLSCLSPAAKGRYGTWSQGGADRTSSASLYRPCHALLLQTL